MTIRCTRSYYSASRLVDELEARAAEPGGEAALEHTDAAWHRLLALFRAVHGGVSAGSLHMPPYDGSLFDPDAHPWLEGRFNPGEDDGSDVLRIDDRTVMHMLRAIQYVEVGTGKGRERRRLTFSSLDVEQIGYVYEGLLGFDAFRADDVVLGLTGRPGEEEEVHLTDLEDLVAEAVSAGETDLKALAERLSDRYKDSGIGSASAVAKKLAPLADDELPDARRRLLSATGNDAPLADRLLPFYRLLRTDLSGLPTVFRKGTLYVTESPLRRFTGTHYTPRFLAEQVVEGALEPLVYSPGPLQTADTKQWKLRPQQRDPRPENRRHRHGLRGVPCRRRPVPRRPAHRSLGRRRRRTRPAASRHYPGSRRGHRHRNRPGGHRGQAADHRALPVRRRHQPDGRRDGQALAVAGLDGPGQAVHIRGRQAGLSATRCSASPASNSSNGCTWTPNAVARCTRTAPGPSPEAAADLAAEVACLRERISRLSDSAEKYPVKRKLLEEAAERGARAVQLADLVDGRSAGQRSRASARKATTRT